MIAGTTTPKCLEPRQKTRKATLPTFALVTQVTFLVALAGRWDPSQNIRANPIQAVLSSGKVWLPVLFLLGLYKEVASTAGSGIAKIDRLPSFSDLEQRFQLKKYRKILIRFYLSILEILILML